MNDRGMRSESATIETRDDRIGFNALKNEFRRLGERVLTNPYVR
jgi:hypothetical protein